MATTGPTGPSSSPSLQEAQNKYNELSKVAKELGRDLSSLSITDVVADFDKIIHYLGIWKDELNDLKSLSYDISSSFKSMADEIGRRNSGLSMSKRIYDSLSDVSKKLADHQAGITTLSSKDVDKLKEKILIEQSSLRGANDQLRIRRDELKEKEKTDGLLPKEQGEYNAIKITLLQNLKTLKNKNDVMAQLNEQSEKVAKSAKNIEKGYGLAGAALDGIGNIIGKIGGSKLKNALGLEEAQREMEKLSIKLTTNGEKAIGFGDKMKVFGAGLSSISKSLFVEAPLLLLSFTFTQIVKSVSETDKRIGDTAKNLNISYSFSNQIDRHMLSISQHSNDIYTNTKGLSESFNTINSSMGTSAIINEEHLKTFTKLREQAGFTNEELKGMSDLSFANKGSLEKNTDEFLKQSELVSKQFGVSLNSKQLMKEIGQVSAATTMSLGKNPKLIAEAVTTAKALGMEMSKIEGIMDSMLDFESSIENELQAELLIGRNLNLEGARWASLNNDVAGAAREINAQIGGSAEFTRMNRIQQEAMANAVGMNREELAKTLFVQEQLAGISGQDSENRKKLFQQRVDEIGLEKAKAEIGNGGIDNLLKQASIQQDLNKSIESMKEIFVEIAQLVIPIVSPFADLVAYLAKSQIVMLSIKAILGAMLGKSIGIAVAQMIGASAMAGPIGFLAGLAGAVALPAIINSYSQPVQDGIAPSSKGPFTITDKFGATAVTAEGDHMVVSPNVSTRGNTTQPQQTTQVVQQSNAEVKETNRLLQALLQKQGNVRIDSTQMGTAIGMNTYQIQ